MEDDNLYVTWEGDTFGYKAYESGSWYISKTTWRIRPVAYFSDPNVAIHKIAFEGFRQATEKIPRQS